MKRVDLARFIFTGTIVAFFTVVCLHAPSAAIERQKIQTAIEGYDPVAYFVQHRPVKGSASITWIHRGREWRFSSEDHRRLFKENPRDYMPQYDGYCAWHIVLEQKVQANPEIFVIINDKLYLFKDEPSKQNFLKNKFKNIRKANLFWRKIN